MNKQDGRNINTVFNPSHYAIAFNENWTKNLENNLEIMVTCFHESRHAYQYSVINGLFKNEDIVIKQTIKQWKQGFKSYHSGSGFA